MNVAVREMGDQVVFLHRLEPGGTDRSYGIHVAQLAGLPDAVVRARVRCWRSWRANIAWCRGRRSRRPTRDSWYSLPKQRRIRRWKPCGT